MTAATNIIYHVISFLRSETTDIKNRWASPEKKNKTARRKIQEKNGNYFSVSANRKRDTTGEIGKIENPFFMLKEKNKI